MKKVLFLCSDGALVSGKPSVLASDVIHALAILQRAGFDCVRIDDTVASEALSSLQAVFDSQGIHFLDVVSVADYNVEAMAAALAPMLAASHLSAKESCLVVQQSHSAATQVEALAARLGIGFISLVEADWLATADKIVGRDRTASARRKSNETDIVVEMNLDSTAPGISINSGLGFFDHMLEQVAKHGGFSMNLRCEGDLHIDEHHTVEDCALAIGETLRQALGDKRGIGRYGFLLPMDETEVQVSMDLSARPSFHFKGQFNRDKVGDLSTEMVPHFFKSLSDTLGASIHITMTGDNAHHQVEATFKAVGRALGQAIKREGTELPSTKGML